MSKKDCVMWNVMLSSFARYGELGGVLKTFNEMRNSGMTPNSLTMTSVLPACAGLAALKLGQELHGNIMKNGLLKDNVHLESAVVDMYAKCGRLDLAHQSFRRMSVKDAVSWNSIITSCTQNSSPEEAIDLFRQMMLDNGIRPDHVTFLAIISACAHTGQVDDGIRYFHYMTEVCGIPKKMEHYACVVDMFGRAGRVNEAFDFIKSMPFQPDAGIWGTLLGACRVYGNVELGKEASRYLLDLDPKNSGYYVLVANMHADASQWRSVRNIRTLMKDRGVNKVPGYSWVDVNHTTHMFVAADGSHPESTKIYSLLQNLLPELRKEGYAPQTYLPMHSHGFGSVNVG
ncbi:Pentatricopeptide repeat-containing protein At4g21300 [Linum grandiflorum]